MTVCEVRDPPTRRQELIAQLMLCVEHPFGGFGQPRGEEKVALVEELLSIPGDGPPNPDAVKGVGRRWSVDDAAALRVLAFVGAPLEETADMLKRETKAIYHRIATNTPGARAPASWSAYARAAGWILA
jgi:hypothetical protein